MGDNCAIEHIAEVVRAEECRRSLMEFAKEFWEVIEPTVDFSENWHHHIICNHLEAVTSGEINKLIINVPPGTSKSSFVSVVWPAWEWATNPGHRYFGASYSEPLSIRDAQLCKAIVTSDKYQKWYGGHGAQIQHGQNQQTKYGTTMGGWRMATSVGGRGTGEHPSRRIIDDPLSAQQAASDLERETPNNWFDGTMSTRGVLHNAATIIIMQRLHMNDLTGHIMKSASYRDGDWVHVIIPMEYEQHRQCPKWFAGSDPRKAEGELLWPEKFTAKKVATLKGELGEYRTAGQLQQRPSPQGGGLLKVKYFDLWPARKALPPFDFIIQSYDTAFTDKTSGDPTACTVWGVFKHTVNGTTRARCMLLDAWAEHLGYPALKKKAMADWKATYGGDDTDPLNKPRRPDLMLIEEKGSGISLIQDLQMSNLPARSYNPGKASKTARAEMSAPLLESGAFVLIESRKEPGQAVRWARPLLAQMEQFPNGEHDDLTDTYTMAAIFLQRAQMLELPSVEDDPIEEIDYHAAKKRRVNPYAQ